jgi:hypothetical protein
MFGALHARAEYRAPAVLAQKDFMTALFRRRAFAQLGRDPFIEQVRVRADHVRLGDQGKIDGNAASGISRFFDSEPENRQFAEQEP